MVNGKCEKLIKQVSFHFLRREKFLLFFKNLFLDEVTQSALITVAKKSSSSREFGLFGVAQLFPPTPIPLHSFGESKLKTIKPICLFISNH